jgi:two-component system OmpR family response regulator
MAFRLSVQRQREQRALMARSNVLVVDDDPADLVYYRTVLQRAGCSVVTCSTYDEALDCLGAEQFDLIVLSQGSAAFEGKRVLQKSIELDPGKQVLVVARVLNMSCYLEAMQLGARDYLEEPVPERDLVRAVEVCLATSSAIAA